MPGGRSGWWSPAGPAGWAVRLVVSCGAGLVAIGVVPTDSGIGYPPGVPEAHTVVGLIHQVVAVALGVAGIAAAVPRAAGPTARGTGPAGTAVASIMALAFPCGSVLVVLDDMEVLPGAPSGLLQRVALFGGLGWIGVVSTVLRAGDRAADARRRGSDAS